MRPYPGAPLLSLPRAARRPSGLRAGDAFTLIELLVVIAVIGILAGMLLPTLTAARERARITTCKSNMRQLLVAAQMYSTGYDEFMPVDDHPKNSHSLLMDYMDPFLGDNKVYYCPSATGDLAYSRENVADGNISYMYFCYSDYKKDSEIVKWLIEGECITTQRSKVKRWVFSDYLWKDRPGSHATYKKGINFVRLDSSVGFIVEQPRKYYEEAFDVNEDSGGGGGGGGGGGSGGGGGGGGGS